MKDRGGQRVVRGEILDPSGCAAQHARKYGRDGPSEALVHSIARKSACKCPKGAYLSLSALLAPLHSPSRTARCVGRRGRIGAHGRHKSARGHTVRTRATLLLAVRAEPRAGAAIFCIAHGAQR